MTNFGGREGRQKKEGAGAAEAARNKRSGKCHDSIVDCASIELAWRSHASQPISAASSVFGIPSANLYAADAAAHSGPEVVPEYRNSNAVAIPRSTDGFSCLSKHFS